MSKNLTLKESVQYAVRLGAIQAADDHASIQAAISTVNDLIDNLSSETTLTYGDVVDGFSSDVMVAFVADSDTTDVSTYTTASKLTHKKAMELTLEISQFQASRDHDSIQAVIDNINNAATITDNEIFALYEEKTVKEYHLQYDTFLTYPQRLLDLLKDKYNSVFEIFDSVTVDGNIINLGVAPSNEPVLISSDKPTRFTITDNGLIATSDNIYYDGYDGYEYYVVDYKKGTVQKKTSV